jgi:hypothetical protein
MSTHTLDLQIAAARYLRWLPGVISATEDEIRVEGWALPFWEDPGLCRFTINGHDVQNLQWPLPSPYLLEHFKDIPGAETAGFSWSHRAQIGESLFPGGFAHLNMTSQFGEHRNSYRTAWFLADPAIEPTMPTAAQVTRVIGVGNLSSFQWGGATIVNRFDRYLTERFDRPIGSFSSVLDWGCGAGRLSRYLSLFSPNLTGVDIDNDYALGKMFYGRRLRSSNCGQSRFSGYAEG